MDLSNSMQSERTAPEGPIYEAPPPTPLAETKIDWQAKIKACTKIRDEKLKVWQDNVSRRVGKALTDQPTQDTVVVPVDWSRTKNKQAQLFFQVPKVQVRPLHPAFTASAPLAGAALNWKLTHEVKAYKAMDECLADCVNASGIAVTMIGFEQVAEKITVPVADLAVQKQQGLTEEMIQAGMADGTIPSMEKDRRVFGRYYMQRVAPQYLVWPAEFGGSDFQEAPWLGWQGWMPTEEARRKLKLPEGFKVNNATETPEYLTNDSDKRKSDDEHVHFTEIFYRAYLYDPAEVHPHKIKRLVIVDGMEKPIVDEDFSWQRYDEEKRRFFGLHAFPIKVLTLTYISDAAIPPSDTEMGRPQVDELNESRSDIIQQRKHSRPMRWYDTNQLDEEVKDLIKKGYVQEMIPTNGPGERCIGEISRAQYPRENFEFMKIIQSDLDSAWASGANQEGRSAGDQSATEANIVENKSNLRLEYERSKVLRFFQENAEGIFALMQMFQDDEEYAEIIGADGVKKLAAWDRHAIPGEYVFEIAPDAAQRIDVNKRLADLMKLYTLARQDAAVNPLPFLREIFALNGFNADDVVREPAPQPEKPTIGYSFKGEDLSNPMVIALLQKSGINLTPEDIMAAKRMVVDVAGEVVAPVPGAPAGAPGAPPAPATPAAHPEHGGTPPVQAPITKRYESGESAV